MIKLQRLRDLTVKPKAHPRGQHHLSAASGLVCAQRGAYVIADDEHHLAVFRDASSAGKLSRLFEGDLPHPTARRKKRKPDLETLMAVPPCTRWPDGALFAMGSGSRPNRQVGVVIPLRPNGAPDSPVHYVDLRPLYEKLQHRFDELNIEGAMFLGETFVLLQRGNKGGSENAALQFRRDDVMGLICGESAKPPKLVQAQVHDLGKVNDAPLCFTDGAALPDGRWVFTAVAENTENSFDDGACAGSAVGIVNPDGRVAALHRLDVAHKVEGIEARLNGDEIQLCLVTDSDDPAQASGLFLARVPNPH